ncbi:type II secretion system F family protein [Pseudactinotalea terrae]|uniref:type II secretion system F family protein n=1 Tax=Pseudactinotalea terrae TaxID=1743262 RepID=UPI0012E32855|nr:type II secretion system F family protein [Pseudactinotalea terrae]
MARFEVRALDPKDQRIITERTQASDEDEVRASLQLRGLTVLRISPVGTGLQMQIGGPKRVKHGDMSVFVRMFATIVSAGVPIMRALEMMTAETTHPTLREALEDVCGKVEAGQSLSAAMTDHPKVFPPLLVSQVSSGEAGGFLEQALLSAADTMEKQVKLASDIKSAATYPVVVLCVGVAAAIGMLLFVLPIFTTMFADLGGELPLPTRVAIALSDVLKVAIAPLVVAGVAFGFWWRSHKNDDAVRAKLDPALLRLPIFGSLIRRIAVARATRVLAVMLSSGVPLVTAIEKSAPTANNKVIADALMAAREHVELGRPMSDHLSDGNHIPTLVSQMVRAGEESGAIDDMLVKVSDFYDQQIESTTKQLSSILEPILIVVVGALIGGLIVAMYMPMFAVFDLIQ